MAIRSSRDCQRITRDFPISPSIEDNCSRISLNSQKCWLCHNSKKTFCCKQCVRNGDFERTGLLQNYASERYAEKKLRLSNLRAGAHDIVKKCHDILNPKYDKFEIEQEIKNTRWRNKYLKVAIKDKNAKIEELKKKLKKLQECNNVVKTNTPRYEERVFKMSTFIANKGYDIETQKLLRDKKNAEVKEFVRRHIKLLTTLIFPISQVLPNRNEEDSAQETIRALADASKMSYYQGRWVFTDSTGELQHCIAGPTLPGSGIYSAYNDYVILNKDGTDGSSEERGPLSLNPAFKISDGLVYTCQLINVLSLYLDVKLLHRMTINDYCSNFMNEQQFSRRVTRLNCNVLYLALSQNVPIEKLQPLHTLENVLRILDTSVSDLGRQGPLELKVCFDDSLESQLNKDLNGGESDSDNDDNLPKDWEAVSSEVPHVDDDLFLNSSNTHMSNTQQAASVAGGLVTTAAANLASMWRGWTTGK